MRTYTPENWAIAKFVSPDHGTIYKVLACWYGGYAGNDSWKLSSSTTSIIHEDGMYSLPQFSGSVYKLIPQAERMTGLMTSQYLGWKAELADMEGMSIEIISFEDFEKEFVTE